VGCTFRVGYDPDDGSHDQHRWDNGDQQTIKRRDLSPHKPRHLYWGFLLTVYGLLPGVLCLRPCGDIPCLSHSYRAPSAVAGSSNSVASASDTAPCTASRSNRPFSALASTAEDRHPLTGVRAGSSGKIS